ncbi:MAG: class I SAM-dependent methyltransferase [Candidatus Bathyarchaeia archaeon]
MKWAEFAEYCYKKGKGTPWNFDGWLGEMLFKEGTEWRLRFGKVKKIIEKINKINPLCCVLDLMCGGAYPSRWLAEQQPQCFVVGIDLDRKALLFAKKRIKKGVDNLDFVRCDVHMLPFKGKIADLTLAIGGLEYVDLKEVLSEVKRVTKKWFVATFTGEKFKRKLHYKLGLVHLRFIFNSKLPRVFKPEEVKQILAFLSEENTIYECGEYNLIAYANLTTYDAEQHANSF